MTNPLGESSMKKCFLFYLAACLLFVSLTGCGVNSGEYTVNLSNKVQKVKMSEGSIQNISKYTAIGVGVMDNKSPQNRYKLIDKENNDIDEAGDYTYNLLGMTENGRIEELTFLEENGNQVSSSNFNITYYEDVGDFVLFSYLPMSKESYVNGFKSFMRNNNDYRDNTEEEINTAAQVNIIGPINRLTYPILWSFKTKSGFVETSFLIHKKSGKIFPYSTHTRYVNISKMRGWIHNSVEDNPEETNITAADIMMPYSEPIYWSYQYDFIHTNCFENGFFVSNVMADYNSFRCIRANNSNLAILKFNEETQNLDVNLITTVRANQFLSRDIANSCDKWGNKIIQFEGDFGYYMYNLLNKKTTKLDDEPRFINNLRLDSYTRQFYSVLESGDVVFYNQDFEVDYQIDVDINSEEDRLIYSLDTTYCIDKENAIVWTGYKIIKLNFDDNGHYSKIPFSVISTPNMSLLNAAAAYGNYYYAKEGILYKVNSSNNYAVEQIGNFPYHVNSVYINEYDNLTFQGADLSSLQEVTGYINSNDEVTFEINHNSNRTTIFTPIN